MLPAVSRAMADKSLDERVALIEASMGGKSLTEHFREHAELIDRRFADVHARLAAQDKHQLGLIRRDVARVHAAVNRILQKLFPNP